MKMQLGQGKIIENQLVEYVHFHIQRTLTGLSCVNLSFLFLFLNLFVFLKSTVCCDDELMIYHRLPCTISVKYR